MDTEQLLALLDDCKVQEKIATIFAQYLKKDIPNFEDSLNYYTDNQELKSLDNMDDIKTLFSQLWYKISNQKSNFQNIVNKINKELCTEKNNSRDLIERKQSLAIDIQNKDNSISILEKENNTLNTSLYDLQQYNQDLQKHSKVIEQQLNILQEDLSNEICIQNIYNSLSEETKESISTIMPDLSIPGIFYFALNKTNILEFWDFIKEFINKSNYDEDIMKIKKIFELLFIDFNKAYPSLQRNDTHKGDHFNSQYHDQHITSSSDNDSTIRKVLLNGIINKDDNTSEKQCIVVL